MIIIFSILVSVIIIGSSYIITEKNAKYYLAGYWNLSPKERSKIDLQAFLANWRRIMWISGGVIIFTAITLSLFAVSIIIGVLIIIVMMLLSQVVLITAWRRARR
jgi:hypothetical protein